MENLWKNNSIQFPRVIEEAQAAGAFTGEVIAEMAESMDLEVKEVHELLDRARKTWEDIKYGDYPFSENAKGDSQSPDQKL